MPTMFYLLCIVIYIFADLDHCKLDLYKYMQNMQGSN